MRLQSAGSQWPRSPVQAIGWGKKGDQAECLSSSQRLFWACSHGSELQGVQEQPERKLAAWQPWDSGYENMAGFIFRPL